MNLTLVTGTTNGFIFQIINSWTESWRVCLTCIGCYWHFNFRSNFHICYFQSLFTFKEAILFSTQTEDVGQGLGAGLETSSLSCTLSPDDSQHHVTGALVSMHVPAYSYSHSHTVCSSIFFIPKSNGVTSIKLMILIYSFESPSLHSFLLDFSSAHRLLLS